MKPGPGHAAPVRGSKPALLRRALDAMAPFLPPHPKRIALALCAMGAVAGLLEVYVLTAIGRLATSVESGGDIESSSIPLLGSPSATELVVGGLVATAGVILLRIVEARVVAWLFASPIARVRDELMRGYLDASFTRQQAEPVGQVQDLLLTHSVRAGLVSFVTANSLSSLTMLLVLGVAAAIIDIVAFAAVGLLLAAFMVVMLPVQRLTRRLGRLQVQANLEYAGHAHEMLSAAKEYRFFGTSGVAADQLDVEARRVSSLAYRARTLTLTMPTLYRSVVFAILLGGLWALLTWGDGRVATATTVVLLMVRALMESRTVHTSLLSVVEAMPYVEEVTERLDRYHRDRFVTGDVVLTDVTDVALDGVRFRYDDDHPPVFERVDFVAHGGEKIGIVGPSGAGKSTVLAILLGLLEPASGRVLINGREPTAYDQRSWVRQVAAVPQTPTLITATVRENIRLFRDWVGDDAIEAAAVAVGMHDEIMSWPNGYETVVGDRGVRALSGGQRQRLCIARALAGRPSLLIMDEPTSALDLAAEEVVTKTVGALGESCTAIVVSHRETALAACDRLVRLEDGVLVG